MSSGFAGAVLAQYGVHFALADIKIDTIIGKDLGTEPLGDAFHGHERQVRRIVHACFAAHGLYLAIH